jgi:glucose-6-phosphate 1-epimerase
VGLLVTNTDDKPFQFQTALHTYFRIGDIHKTYVKGLQGVELIDSLREKAHETETRDAIGFDQEVDRIYIKTPEHVWIDDQANSRIIDIRKQNMADVVVWNPWIEKSKRMADYGDDEYLEMVCVETGVIENPVELAPGKDYQGRTQFSYRNR